MRAVLPGMIAKKGKIVKRRRAPSACAAALGGWPTRRPKWGLSGIHQEALPLAPGPTDHVNNIAPHGRRPAFSRQGVRRHGQKLGITAEEAARAARRRLCMKRITNDTDVANACLFMASDVSRQITGGRPAGRRRLAAL